MEENKMTPAEAWADFYRWVKLPANWRRIKRSGRDQIAKAQRSYEHGVPAPLGELRIERLLTTFAPGRYRFEKAVAVWVVGE